MENKKFDLNILENYLQEHLIVKQKHPTFDIWIYNYTPECVFSRKWDKITAQCRGLILDEEGYVVGRPMEKFFNYDELEGLGISLPEGTPKIYTKLDGSLIIVTRYKDELIVATRGSFVSDQAKLARELLIQDDDLRKIVMSVDNQFTFLFELTGPDNRIVVTYPENKLTLLAVITNWNGKEHNLKAYKIIGVKNIVEEYEAKWNENTIKYLQSLNLNNEEGFVLKWDNNFRTKIKFSSYVRLHRLITGLNEKTIWEWMKDSKCVDEIVKNVPEEFREWVESITYKFWEAFNRINLRCCIFFRDNKLAYITRKEAALLIMKEAFEYPSVLFSMIDNDKEKWEKAIWKIIKPKTNKVFKDGEEL